MTTPDPTEPAGAPLTLGPKALAEWDELQQLTRRSFVTKASSALALSTLSGAFLAACGGSSKSPSTSGTNGGGSSAATGPITIASSGAWQGFDCLNPAFIANGPSMELLMACSGTLTEVILPPSLAAAKAAAAKGALNGQPALAESWTTAKGGAVYRFNLRKNATSGYGNPLTADDVVWTFSRALANPTSVCAFLLGLGGITKPSMLKAVDANTLEVRLAAPPAVYFLQILGLVWLSIIDSTEAKKHATASDKWASKWLTSNIAGHGRYKLQSTVPNKSAVLVPNPGFYGPKAPFTKISQEGLDDQSGRLQLLLTGSAKYAEELTPLQLKQASGNGGSKVVNFTSTRVAFLSMDNSKAPFNSPELRQGIARAIPYDDIISSVYKGFAERWRSMFIPWFQGSTDAHWDYETDPAAAAKALASVKGMPVTLNYVQGFGVGQQIAVLVQQALNKAGLKCSLKGLLRSVADKEKVGKPGLAFFIDDSDSPAVPHPLYQLQYMYTSKAFQNMAGYKNPKLDALATKLGATKGIPAQNQIVDQCNQILVNDLPYIPIAYTGTAGAAAKTLGGVGGTEVGLVYYPGLQPTAA